MRVEILEIGDFFRILKELWADNYGEVVTNCHGLQGYEGGMF